MSHAWVGIFGSHQHNLFPDAVREIGPSGHRKAWNIVFRMCVWTAREHFGLRCIGQEHYLADIDDCVVVVGAAESLADIDTEALSFKDLTENIAVKLNVPFEHARLFPKLLVSGLKKFEALIVVWGSDLTLWAKPELRVKDMMPVDWRWT